MSLQPGTVIGRYEIESLIAVGGMGEVYRARDHELHRSIALNYAFSILMRLKAKIKALLKA